MSFSDPRWLHALWALPVFVLLELWAARRAGARLRRLLGPNTDHPLLSQRRPRERFIGAALRLLAFAALVMGASGPEWGREVVRRGSTGSDVVLLVDVSASMDTRDVPPSRIDEARREALAVLDRMSGSRVGVVAFAGDAVRLVPLTLDLPAVRLVLESLSSGSLSEPGTDLGRALEMALKVMPPGRREEQAIVLWTDGEDLERGARERIDAVANSGIRVFAVGVGTRAGDVVPVLDSDGRATDVKRDENGNAVRSRIDEDLLRTLARRTRGAYFAASRPGGELSRLLAAVENLARAGRSQRLVERPVARFPLFGGLAALLLALERIRWRRRRRAVNDWLPLHSETKAAAAAAAALLALLWMPQPADAQSAWARGDRAFRRQRWAEAESLYALRLRHKAPDAVRVNHATSRALSGDAATGEQELERVARTPGREAGNAGYNLGTLRADHGDDAAALESLRRVLEQHPSDEDARWNYEVVLRRMQQPSNKNPQKPPPSPSGGGGGGTGGGGAPQPRPSAPQPNPAPQTNTPAPSTPTPTSSGAMTREQADQLLNALQEMARADQQRHRNVRAVNERRGRDW
jgi:Ca-activated chloride channel family protein